MNTEITPFEFQGHQVRILPHKDGASFWAVAKDVCDILGYVTVTDPLRKVPEKHKGKHRVPTPGGLQEMLCVDEAGLYRLVLRSDKPEAEPFMEWVTAEVLPTIRKQGYYEAPSAFQKRMAEQDDTLIFLAGENGRLKAENDKLKDELLERYRAENAALRSQLEPKKNDPDVTPEETAQILALYKAGKGPAYLPTY
jgi:prophage antirepressor-like protein